ncbi:MAG TPA: hypothetical protein VF789_21965 [Thermoanaerobaculia bacterium]
MKALDVLRRFTYISLALTLFAPLAGCGGEADAGADEHTKPSAHLTLTGSLQADGEFVVDCGIYSDRGLQLTFAPPMHGGEHGGELQIQVRINDYIGAGQYPVGIVINEHEGHGHLKRWNGVATANIQSRVARTRSIREQSEVSGSFEGTYEGQGGQQGTIRGTFQSCASRELIP